MTFSNLKKEFETDDPFELNGVILPATEEADFEMIHCFIDEYMWMGWGQEQILNLFKNPEYMAGYCVYCDKGEEVICKMIQDRFNMWGGA